MVTNLGRFLRKIRIDKDEILKDMADHFGVTASYLSAVENGIRPMPERWKPIIIDKYQLNKEQQNELQKLIIESTDTVHINLANADYQNKELALAFARKATDLSDEMVKNIQKLLGGE